MAVSTIQTNNKAITFRTDITREYVRENLFSPYMGSDITAIIRKILDPQKNGGEQVNIPLVSRLAASAVGSGPLNGNEENIDNYGMRAWVDWARNAVKTNNAEQQRDSANVFGQAKPLLSDWGKELQRDEIIGGFMALPSESSPAGLGSSAGQRVNGILYEAATAAQRNTWNSDNSDRVLYGSLLSNYNATHATALANVASTAKLSTANGSLLKRIARTARPRIRPFKVGDGREFFVAFCSTNAFRDIKIDLATVNKDARPREGRGMDDNPLFQDGDELYDGVIYREIPEIDYFVDNVWTSLKTAGTTSARITPVFFCGQSAMAMAWAKMPQPTTLDDTDYQFNQGVGVQMCYGVAKMFKKHPQAGTKLVQWGVATGFFGSAADA